jgi:hypothetical protein
LPALPDLIFVTESWLLPGVTYKFRGLEHYTVYRHDRNERGGGVLVLANPLLSISIPSLPVPSCGAEILVLDLRVSAAHSTRFVLIY